MSGVELKVGKKRKKHVMTDSEQDVTVKKKKSSHGRLKSTPSPLKTANNIQIEEQEEEPCTSTINKSDDDMSLSVPLKLFVCPCCPDYSYTCKNKRTMHSHLKKHPDAIIEGTTEKLTAKHCVEDDPIKIRKIMESKASKLPFPCKFPGCNERFKSKNTRRTHKSRNHAVKFKYYCPEPLCGRLEYTLGKMKSHYRNNHPHITCDDSHLEVCEKRMTEIYEEAEKNNREVKQPKYPCTVCSKSCDFPYQLKGHMQTHELEDRTCQDKSCGKIFKQPCIREVHERIHDPNFTKFICTISADCQQRFPIASKLKSHQKYSSRHNKNPAFTCEKCKRSFFWQAHLKIHQQKPCPSFRRECAYRCSRCKKGYHFKKNYEKHVVKCESGKLNLQEPSDEMKQKYRKLIYDCSEAIRMDGCNKNQIKSDSPCHVIVVPCPKCPKKAIMYSSAPTPWHHVKMLLDGMIRGLACTSLHAHMDDKGEGHLLDVENAKFVAEGFDPYDMHMIKKVIVKMAKKEGTVTNHLEYELYHKYDSTALDEIFNIMNRENLTKKSKDDFDKEIDVHLKKLLTAEGTVRQHEPLVYKDNIFQRLELTDGDDGDIELLDHQKLLNEMNDDDEFDWEQSEDEHEDDEE